MADFVDFRTQARAEFPDLNISVMMYEKESTTGSSPTVYRLKAAGMPIGPAPLTAEAVSPSEAIAQLRRLVGTARRSHRASCEAAALARHRASNPTPAPRPAITARRAQPVYK